MNRREHFINPYMPSWEYVPDGEPHVFGGRVYVYGSHDSFNGYVFCQNDYVCYSAPENDLRDWRYEGVIYEKTQDPFNPDGAMCLYAPDVTVGPDGRYYLYYVLDKVSVVSVAVCDTPAGKYEFLGYVHYSDGTLYGRKEGDEPQYDPAVLTEGDKTYLYTGFCFGHDRSRHGCMAVVLGADMLTVVENPVFVMPSGSYSAGSGSEGHEYFEGPSIRKIKGRYYLVYCSVHLHELCYAVSDEPTRGFKYMGVVISNSDIGISSYKPADKSVFYSGNVHGGIVQAGGEWYIFYHRHTNGTSFSRQACFERLNILDDGRIPQVEITSVCGREPLPAVGEYPAYIVCNLMPGERTAPDGRRLNPWMNGQFPRVTQDGRDGDETDGHIANMTDGSVAGFKYFDFKGVKRLSVYTRGYGKGEYVVSASLGGEALGSVKVDFTNIWIKFTADVAIPDGVHALYLTFRGTGGSSLKSFVFDTE